MHESPFQFLCQSLRTIDGNRRHAEAFGDLHPVQKRIIQAQHGAGIWSTPQRLRKLANTLTALTRYAKCRDQIWGAAFDERNTKASLCRSSRAE